MLSITRLEVVFCYHERVVKRVIKRKDQVVITKMNIFALPMQILEIFFKTKTEMLKNILLKHFEKGLNKLVYRKCRRGSRKI